MIQYHTISLWLLLIMLLISGCRSNHSAVQIDRPSTPIVKNEKASSSKPKESFIQQTSGDIPIKSELDNNQESSLIKKNPISKLIGKFNSKPKRIPLPRTDLNSKPEETLNQAFKQKEPEIPLEDISF